MATRNIVRSFNFWNQIGPCYRPRKHVKEIFGIGVNRIWWGSFNIDGNFLIFHRSDYRFNLYLQFRIFLNHGNNHDFSRNIYNKGV